MLNVGNYKQFIFESSLDRDNCVKLSSNIGAGGLPGLSCDRGNSDGDPVWAVCAVPRVVEHMNTSLGFNHCEMWHVGPLCTVMCCPLCTGVMMSSVSSGVLLCWWSHDLWGRHRHTRPRDPEIWGEGQQQQCIPRPWYTWSYQDTFESSCLFSTVCGMKQFDGELILSNSKLFY